MRVRFTTGFNRNYKTINTYFIFEKKLSLKVRSSIVCKKKLCGCLAETTITFLQNRPKCDSYVKPFEKSSTRKNKKKYFVIKNFVKF